MSRKSDSFLEKLIPLGTIQRRQRMKKEIEELKVEGINAIQAVQNITLDPDFYELKENEERSALEIGEKKKLEPLIKILTEWINNELIEQRIIVKDLQEDLHDGRILQILIDKLSGNTFSTDRKLNLGEVSQKQNLKHLLEFINSTLGIHPMISKWKVENIYEKDLIAILHLLVAIVRHFRIPIELPENVTVRVIIIQKKKTLEKITVTEQITGCFSDHQDSDVKKDRDAFDTLFEHAPEKLSLVQNSLLTFLRKHLKKLQLPVNDIQTELCDGVYFIVLISLLEGYFIPHYAYHPNPHNFEQRLDNCKYLFSLIDDACLVKPNCSPQDIANNDLKSILRTLYVLFSHYKDRD